MAVATQRFEYAPPVVSVRPTRGSFFKRLIEALKVSREAQARREINRHMPFLASVGRDESTRGDLPF